MTDQTTTAAPETSVPATAEAPDFAQLRTQLPSDLADHPALKSYTSLEGLARSHVAAQRMIGKRIEDATPDELGRYYARHGRPAKPEGYEFPVSQAREPGVETPQSELERAARAWFHEAGLSQRQAEILHDRWSAFSGQSARDFDFASRERRASAERDLRSEWGHVYDRKVQTAVRAVAQFGGDDLAAFLEETGLGDDPRLVRAFARIAETIGEDSLVGAGDRDFAIHPDAAREEIARALRDPVYFDANHPEHDASVERMRSLFAAAYPEMPR